MNLEATNQRVNAHDAATSIFIHLKDDGDSVTGVFLGEPYAYELIWTGKEYRAFVEGKDNPKKSTLRIAWNFYVIESGTVKIIQGNKQWFKAIRVVNDKYDLEKASFEIKRSGKAGSTSTTYSVLFEKDISDELREDLEQAQLHDLEECISDGNDEDFNSYENEKSAEKPAPKPAAKPKAKATSRSRSKPKSTTIDPDTASEFVKRLKALGVEVAEDFVKHFGIKRIRDLPANKAKEADVFILTQEQAGAVDPFAE